MPTLTAEPRSDVGFALESVAAFGLPDTCRALPHEPLDDSRWPRFLDAVASERLPGLLAAAIADGALPVTDAQRAAAVALETDVAVGALLLERLLLVVTERLTEQGLAVRVLKGPSVAHADYPDPSLRCFGDIDLLVRGDDFERVLTTLAGAGGWRPVPELRRGFDRRFGKGATIAMPGDLELDLHRTLAAGPLGMTIDPDDLFARSTQFVIGGRKVDGLATEERFLHACIHAGLAPDAPLSSLRDVVQIARRPDLDLSRALGLARKWQARAVIARALKLAWSTFDLTESAPASAWADSFEPDAADVRMLDAYLGGDRSYTRRAVATLRVIPRGRDKLAFARSLLFPGRENLAARRVGRLDHVRRGTRHLRRGAPR